MQAFAKHDVAIPKSLPIEVQAKMRAARKEMMKIYLLDCAPANRALSPHRGQEDDIFVRALDVELNQSGLSAYGARLQQQAKEGDLSQEEIRYSMIAAYGAKLFNDVKNAKDEIAGTNCGELAAMGFVALARLEDNPSIDRISFDKENAPKDKIPDHAFLVLNRDINTDPTDFKTWNKEAFVLDVYARAIYPAFQFQEKMVDGQMDFSKGQSKTYLLARHPEKTEFALGEDISEFPDGPIPMPHELVERQKSA